MKDYYKNYPGSSAPSLIQTDGNPLLHKKAMEAWQSTQKLTPDMPVIKPVAPKPPPVPENYTSKEKWNAAITNYYKQYPGSSAPSLSSMGGNDYFHNEATKIWQSTQKLTPDMPVIKPTAPANPVGTASYDLMVKKASKTTYVANIKKIFDDPITPNSFKQSFEELGVSADSQQAYQVYQQQGERSRAT